MNVTCPYIVIADVFIFRKAQLSMTIYAKKPCYVKTCLPHSCERNVFFTRKIVLVKLYSRAMQSEIAEKMCRPTHNYFRYISLYVVFYQ